MKTLFILLLLFITNSVYSQIDSVETKQNIYTGTVININKEFLVIKTGEKSTTNAKILDVINLKISSINPNKKYIDSLFCLAKNIDCNKINDIIIRNKPLESLVIKKENSNITNIQLGGQYINKGSSQILTGIGVTIFGVAASTIIGLTSKSSNTVRVSQIIGLGGSVIGGIITFNGIINIGKGGNYLSNYQ